MALQEKYTESISKSERYERIAMLVRMSHWNCKPEFWGRDQALFEGQAVPIMQGHEGFVRAMLLGVPEKTDRIAFTVWTDQDAYAGFRASPDLARITDMFAPMYVDGALPRPSDFEVRASGDGRSTAQQ